MKRNLILLKSAVLLLLLMSSCNPAFFGGHLNSDFDEFMNARRSILIQSVNDKDKRNGIEWATITYTHEMRNNAEVVELYFAARRSAETFDIEKTGYVKVGDRMYETPLKILNPVMDKHVETYTEKVTASDTTALVTTEATTSGTTSYLIDKFTFRLTQEAVAGLKNGEALSFRFYFGPVAATYDIKGMRLNKVRKLLLK